MFKRFTPAGLFLAVFWFLAPSQSYAQQLLALHSRGSISYYTKISEAYSNAADGDTLYLPGGNLALEGDWIISRRLVVVGAGHHPDTTLNKTGRTVLTGGNIILTSGASGGHFTGFFLQQSIYLGRNQTDADISNLTITRVNVDKLVLAPCESCLSRASNLTLHENIIRSSFDLAHYDNANIFSTVVVGGVRRSGRATLFENCMFHGTNQDTLAYEIISASFNRCVFFNRLIESTTSSNNDYNNSVFFNTTQLPSGSVGSNNVLGGITPQAYFVSFTENGFSYKNNYLLKNPNPDVEANPGIYGGRFPAKFGYKPFNPFFQRVKVATFTAPNGTLPIELQIEAQPR